MNVKQSVWAPRPVYFNSLGVYAATTQGLNVTAAPRTTTALNGVQIRLTPEERQKVIDDQRQAATAAVAKDYNETIAFYSDKMSTENIDLCKAKVSNPFNRAEVDAMIACFKEKHAATEKATAEWNKKVEGADAAANAAAAAAAAANALVEPELQQASMLGSLGTWQMAGIAGIALLVTYLGYKWYQEKKTV